jgi:hypothetical protein
MSALDDSKTGDTTSSSDNFKVPPSALGHVTCAHDDLERRILRKLDLRMSIIVVIFTLNYVSLTCFFGMYTAHCALMTRLTDRMFRM